MQEDGLKISSRHDVEPRTHMRCTKCGSAETRVFDQGAAEMGPLKGYGRRRRCKVCEHTWRTIELNPKGMALLQALTRFTDIWRG